MKRSVNKGRQQLLLEHTHREFEPLSFVKRSMRRQIGIVLEIAPKLRTGPGI
jgi:hypothetical protein